MPPDSKAAIYILFTLLPGAAVRLGRMPSGAGGDPWLERMRVSLCAACRAPLAHDQRYCVECGERRDLLARSIADLLPPRRGEDAVSRAGATAAGAEAARAPSSASRGARNGPSG